MEETEYLERLKIHTILLVRYMSRSTGGLQKMREQIKAVHEEVTFPAQVSCLSKPPLIKEYKRRGEIKASWVVFMVKGKMVGQSVVSNGVTASGKQYKVEPYTSAGPDSLCEYCCRWGHIESKCNHNPFSG